MSAKYVTEDNFAKSYAVCSEKPSRLLSESVHKYFWYMNAVNMFTFWSLHIIAIFCVKNGESCSHSILLIPDKSTLELM